MKTRTITIATLVMLSAVIFLMPVSDHSADSGFFVEDGQGNVIGYDAASEMVVTVGKGLTATVIELGYLDKIIVCDNYSLGSEDVFSDLKIRVNAKEVYAGGNIYSSGKSQLITDIVYVSENKGFDRKTDTIIMTGSETYLNDIVRELRSYGFERILVWNDITTYPDLIDFVENVSLVVSGEVSDVVGQMHHVTDLIASTLLLNGIVSESSKTNAFYVTYSGGAFKVGNTGSLATSMILSAGGNAVTVNEDKNKPTYDENLTYLIEKYGNETIVFMDNTVVKNELHLNSIRDMMPGVTLVALEPLWNNFDPDSMEGVWVMACAMYPDLFSGEVPAVPSGDGNDLVFYAASSTIACAMIGCAGCFFLRRQ